MPTEIDEVNRRVMQLEIELQALQKETDEASLARRRSSSASWPRRASSSTA